MTIEARIYSQRRLAWANFKRLKEEFASASQARNSVAGSNRSGPTWVPGGGSRLSGGQEKKSEGGSGGVEGGSGESQEERGRMKELSKANHCKWV